MSRYAALIVVTGLFAPAFAFAQAAPTFESLDTNKDGHISLNEATVNDDVFVKFKSLDTNKDGMLSKEEFAAYKK